MIADNMAFPDNAPNQFGMGFRPRADEKEGRANVMLAQNIQYKRGYPVIRDIIEGKGDSAESALGAMKLENMRVFRSKLSQAQMVLAYPGFRILRSRLGWLGDRRLLLLHGGFLFHSLPS